MSKPKRLGVICLVFLMLLHPSWPLSDTILNHSMTTVNRTVFTWLFSGTECQLHGIKRDLEMIGANITQHYEWIFNKWLNLITSVNVNITCHKHELICNYINKENGERRRREINRKVAGEGKRKETEPNCIVSLHPLCRVAVNYTYHNRTLIKSGSSVNLRFCAFYYNKIMFTSSSEALKRLMTRAADGWQRESCKASKSQ